MLPDPALSITIPSVHDDATLECRIYHPQSLTANPQAPPWRKHAAVLAHPYAPLGGCFDDPVVETLAATLMRQGFLVGTFNFRGAGNSGGRTSWTSKAERNDYMSFLGFVYYYVHYLDPFRRGQSSMSSSDQPLSPTTNEYGAHDYSDSESVVNRSVLLQCGYSYGAMITRLLPPLESVLEIFAAPKNASAAADIRLRAQHLAQQQNVILGSARAALMEPTSSVSPRRATPGLRIGGDEDKRRSQDHGGRRSFAMDAEEKVRAGVAELMKKTKMHQLHSHRRKGGSHPKEKEVPTTGNGGEADRGTEEDHLPAVAGLPSPVVAYLLVSPPLGWATSLMTLNTGNPIAGLFGKYTRPKSKDTEDQAAASGQAESKQERQKLIEHPTLTIYGDSDVFVAVKRFRDWATKLQSAPGSRFRAHEISTAGHFYIEEGTMQRLADAARAFSGELLAQVQEGL
ncbi:hypothetical protein DHEL01_v204750 [Diaporthe helianthi]|uniref:Prolyl oligopeptidase n=1 Tax=Diaporthe helianthi TaxID=158607 RepID=A0A2P5I300_DIAHE|nr:hypothetical protein DHEL01_v204750 [Diaporthe helianthi]